MAVPSASSSSKPAGMEKSALRVGERQQNWIVGGLALLRAVQGVEPVHRVLTRRSSRLRVGSSAMSSQRRMKAYTAHSAWRLRLGSTRNA